MLIVIFSYYLLFFHNNILKYFTNDRKKTGLELIPQPLYSHVKSPVSVSGQTGTEWDVLGGQQSGLGGGAVNNANPDGLRTFSPLESR